MILKNSLYKIISFEPEKRSFILELMPGSVIYAAHFPDMPVTPGVCIIQIVGELLDELTGTRHELTGVSNAKFLAVISPDKTRTIECSFRKIEFGDDPGTLRVSAVMSDAETVFTKLSLAYKKK